VATVPVFANINLGAAVAAPSGFMPRPQHGGNRDGRPATRTARKTWLLIAMREVSAVPATGFIASLTNRSGIDQDLNPP
jgi:hypothetical protein